MRVNHRRTTIFCTAALLGASGVMLAGVASCSSGSEGSGAPSVTTSTSAAASAVASIPASVSSDASTSAGTALAALESLPVKGRAPKTGYARDQFGQAWTDVDRNGCDTRTDILLASLTEIQKSGRCTIQSGTLLDPYTATTIYYVRGGRSEIDIDHTVSAPATGALGVFPGRTVSGMPLTWAL